MSNDLRLSKVTEERAMSVPPAIDSYLSAGPSGTPEEVPGAVREYLAKATEIRGKESCC